MVRLFVSMSVCVRVQEYRVLANPQGITLLDDVLDYAGCEAGSGGLVVESSCERERERERETAFRAVQRLTLLEMTAIFDECNIDCTVSIPNYSRKPVSFKRSRGALHCSALPSLHFPSLHVPPARPAAHSPPLFSSRLSTTRLSLSLSLSFCLRLLSFRRLRPASGSHSPLALIARRQPHIAAIRESNLLYSIIRPPGRMTKHRRLLYTAEQSRIEYCTCTVGACASLMSRVNDVSYYSICVSRHTRLCCCFCFCCCFSTRMLSRRFPFPIFLPST